MIRFKCPQCGGSLEAPESQSVAEISCLVCGFLAHIPSSKNDYFRFPCPSCGNKLKAKPEDTGKKGRCTKCGTRFFVPATASPKTAESAFPKPRAAAGSVDPVPQSSKQWFYTKDGKSKVGPLSFKELQALAATGQVPPTEMVWKEGMSKWSRADEVNGLLFPKNHAIPMALPVDPIAVVAEADSEDNPRNRSYYEYRRKYYEQHIPLIFDAILDKNLPAVKSMLNSDPMLILINHESFGTPLHNAAFNGLGKIAALLLRRGADPNAQDRTGNTPLHVLGLSEENARSGLYEGSLCVAQALLGHGANVKARNNEDSTPMHNAVLRSPDIVRLLLSQGADPEAKNKKGYSPLHEISLTYPDPDSLKHAETMIRLLLNEGVHVNVTDNNGITPLTYALCGLQHATEVKDNEAISAAKELVGFLRKCGGKEKVLGRGCRPIAGCLTLLFLMCCCGLPIGWLVGNGYRPPMKESRNTSQRVPGVNPKDINQGSKKTKPGAQPSPPKPPVPPPQHPPPVHPEGANHPAPPKPSPEPRYLNKTAKEWDEHASRNIYNETALSQAAKAFVALKEEGMPFLLERLGKARTPQARNWWLENYIYKVKEHIQSDDLEKIVPCLDKNEYLLRTRILALRILAERKESKEHSEKIEMLVNDLKQLPEIKKLLETIKD